MPELTMPRLSDTMEEGTIGRWVKQLGDQVEKGDILVEIETDKATMELEAYDSGTLQKIMVQEGETVAIGTPIAIVGEGEVEEVAAAAPAAQSQAAAQKGQPAATQTAAPPVQTNGHSQADGSQVKASPVAKRLAAEYNIDLRMVQGTGPGGRIIKENVEQFRSDQGGAPAEKAPAPAPAPAAKAPMPAPAPAPAPAPEAAPTAEDTVLPMSRMRRAIARTMGQAKHGMPHIYVTGEVDMAEALTLRQEINNSGASPVKISVNDMITKAVARALVKFPVLNSSYGTDEKGQPVIIQHPQINVCVAISIDEGLVAPVVVDTDKKSLSTISAEIKDMASRAREGKIRADELDKGTFTISNLGMYDVVEFGAIITPPQAAILAVGAVRKTPVVRDDEMVIGQMMYLTVSTDHRLADGAVAAQYVQEVKRLLEAPMSLLV